MQVAVDHILQASRTSGYDGIPITDSWIAALNDGGMLYVRLFTMAISSLSAFSLVRWGISGFPWYMSDWAAFGSVLTTVLLFMSHFRPHDQGYDNLCKALFEIALPFNAMTTLLYWTTYTIPEINGDWNTWVYPYFMHVAPFAALLIEALTNNIVFDYQRGVWRSLWALLSYFPLSYFSNEVWGDFAYSFITWDSLDTPMWLAIVTVVDLVFFYGLGFLNNYVKTGSGVGHLASQFTTMI